MQKEKEEEFTFTWIIENFSMCHQSKEQFFNSPLFALNSLPGMKWCIQLYPKGKVNENYVAVYLQKKDDLPQECSIKFSIEGLDCNEKTLTDLKDVDVSAFESENDWGYKEFLKRESFIESLINDILIIKCTLKPVFEINEQEILPPLLYNDGLFTDVVLRAGDAAFKVHKAILWARWPKLVEKLDAEETCEQIFDIGSNVLDALIKYIYTGKMDCTICYSLVKLYDAAVKYELPNLQCVPIGAQKGRTRINVNKVMFEWPIKNISNLPNKTVLHSRIFAVDTLKSCRWNLSLHVDKKTENLTYFDISICKRYDDELKPIFVRSKISFDKTVSSENEHFFQTNEKWICAEFSRNISTNAEDILLLKCEFKFSNCDYFTEVVESYPAFTSSINCHHFTSDLLNLYKTGTFSDVNIIVGTKTFPAHKGILCARSPVFARMFETDMAESKKKTIEISDVDPDVMDTFLVFIYTGTLEPLLEEIAEQLYTVAEKYDVFVLKKKCLSFLKSDLTAKNVYKVLQLADTHSDDDLYNSAFEFSYADVGELFSTEEWKDKAKENLWIKFLQDMVIHKNSIQDLNKTTV